MVPILHSQNKVAPTWSLDYFHFPQLRPKPYFSNPYFSDKMDHLRWARVDRVAGRKCPRRRGVWTNENSPHVRPPEASSSSSRASPFYVFTTEFAVNLSFYASDMHQEIVMTLFIIKAQIAMSAYISEHHLFMH